MTWMRFLHWMKNIAAFLGATVTVAALVGLMFYDALSKIGEKENVAKISKMMGLGAAQPVSFSRSNNASQIDCEAIRRCLRPDAQRTSNPSPSRGTVAGGRNNPPSNGRSNRQTPAPFAKPPLVNNPQWLEAARRKGTILRSTPAMANPSVSLNGEPALAEPEPDKTFAPSKGGNTTGGKPSGATLTGNASRPAVFLPFPPSSARGNSPECQGESEKGENATEKRTSPSNSSAANSCPARCQN